MNINMQTFNDNMICDNHGLDPWEKTMCGDVKNIVTREQKFACIGYQIDTLFRSRRYLIPDAYFVVHTSRSFTCAILY